MGAFNICKAADYVSSPYSTFNLLAHLDYFAILVIVHVLQLL